MLDNHRVVLVQSSREPVFRKRKPGIDGMLRWSSYQHYRCEENCNDILDAIGDTPMVRINRITTGLVKATVLRRSRPSIPAIPSRTAWPCG